MVGVGSDRGTAIRVADAADHIYGFCLVNDWSARDIQAYEYQPLGPFLGKSFATSMSPWLVSLEALAPYRVAQPDPGSAGGGLLARIGALGFRPAPRSPDREQGDAGGRNRANGGEPQRFCRHVLDGCPAARACDGQRGCHSPWRPLRVGHRFGTYAWERRQPPRAHLAGGASAGAARRDGADLPPKRRSRHLARLGRRR